MVRSVIALRSTRSRIRAFATEIVTARFSVFAPSHPRTREPSHLRTLFHRHSHCASRDRSVSVIRAGLRIDRAAGVCSPPAAPAVRTRARTRRRPRQRRRPQPAADAAADQLVPARRRDQSRADAKRQHAHADMDGGHNATDYDIQIGCTVRRVRITCAITRRKRTTPGRAADRERTARSTPRVHSHNSCGSGSAVGRVRLPLMSARARSGLRCISGSRGASR